MAYGVKKRFYRQRAHANPFKTTGMDIPSDPSSIDWAMYFGIHKTPKFVDIGCGYGKFLLKAAEKQPDCNVLGIEIREKVYSYVKAMIYKTNVQNAGVMKTNALIFLPNIFSENQLEKIFILFPDPHFKRKKQKGRIVCLQTLEVYEYILQNFGRVYISTDVEELFNYMVRTILLNGSFRSLSEEEEILDEFFQMTRDGTDEASRAGLKTGVVFAKIFELNKRCSKTDLGEA